jgi:hemoglobin
MSVFERVGGTPAVTALIDNFYVKIMASPLVTPTFAGRDISTIKAHSVAYFASALGSGVAYEGRTILQSHTGLGVTEEQYNAVAAMLVATMNEMNIPADIQAAIVGVATSIKAEIVGH